MSNSQTIQTIANFINQNLPFVLFLLLPFLYNQINGYSVVISLSFSAIFILISTQSWLELRSRFKFQQYLYTRKNQYPKPKITIFNCLETTLGLNFAIIISVLVILNGIALHCMTIKWFFEDITKHLFHFLDENHQHSECTITNDSQIGNSSDTAHIHDHILFKSNKIVVFVEILISILYFIVLILSSRLIIKCESFFKNSFQSTFSGLERQKKYSTKLKAWKNSSITPKYFLIVIKITSTVLISLGFIFLLNLFTPYRNLCCSEFYESFLNHPDHGKHIIKQFAKYSGSMLTHIFNTLFNDNGINETREESSIENDQNESERIFSILVESDTSKAIFFSNKENYPLIRQQLEKQKTKIYNQKLKEENEMMEEKEMDDQSIDQIFAEYMGELKIKALSDKDLSFGDKQPSMKSAYTAIVVDLKNWLSYFYFLSILLGLAAVKLVVAILFFFKNTKEKKLKIKFTFQKNSNENWFINVFGFCFHLYIKDRVGAEAGVRSWDRRVVTFYLNSNHQFRQIFLEKFVLTKTCIVLNMLSRLPEKLSEFSKYQIKKNFTPELFKSPKKKSKSGL
ncbi:hypothetical protein BpHYR1_017751 [Brachionus plicatilis]|uniref:Transmembrane protein n=1 Tax=Brachionus plicatilis TaxID=10195 RepID=A0A3M7S731_BRAPC|nr:hypothetical protein BpHYR1_017751 [Brachionus plicatilis]